MNSIFFQAPATHLIDLFLLSIVVLVAYTLSEKFFSGLFNVKFSSGLERFLFLEGLGLGAIAYLTFTLGLFGLLYRPVLYILLAAALLLTLDRIVAIFQDIRIRFPDHRSRTEIVLISLIIIFMLLALLSALTPPTSLDEMMYHLTVPKLYAQSHRIYNIPEISRSGWIMSQEMLFTAGLILKGDILAKLLHFLMGILTTLAVYAFSRNFMSKSASLLASLIFFSTPMVFWLSTVANNDLGLTFFEFLAVYGAVNWLRSKSKEWLNLAAVFCGLALGTKYIGIFTLVAIIMMMAADSSFKNRRGLLNNILVLCTIAFSIASIWHIKNFLFLQNPIFPFANNLFHSRYWYTDFWKMDLGTFGAGKGIMDYLLLPWNLTLHCRYFSRVGYIGPIFLMSLPLLLLAPLKKIRLNADIRSLIIYSAVFFVLWAFSSQYIRYLVPLLPFLSILAAYSIFSLETIFNDPIIFKAILAFVIMILFLNLPFFGHYWVDSKYWGRFCYTVSYSDYAHPNDTKLFKLARKVVFGKISRDEYLSQHAHTEGVYPLIRHININLASRAKILTIDDFLRYYYDREVICDYDFFPQYGISFVDLFAKPSIKYYPGMWSEDFFQKLKGLKVTHLLVNFINLQLSGVDLVADKRFSEFTRKHLKPKVYSREAALYEVVYD